MTFLVLIYLLLAGAAIAGLLLYLAAALLEELGAAKFRKPQDDKHK